MSWDVGILNLGDFASVEDIPEDHQLQPIGPVETVRHAIDRLFPGVQFDSEGWGSFSAGDWSVEFNSLKTDPVESITLHVRGGEDAVPAILALTEELGVRALDYSTGDFLNEEVGRESFLRWKAYRDRVVNKNC